jgi:hypothetical protein
MFLTVCAPKKRNKTGGGYFGLRVADMHRYMPMSTGEAANRAGHARGSAGSAPAPTARRLARGAAIGTTTGDVSRSI